MFWIWSSSVAAILVGAFVSFNYLFNIPVARLNLSRYLLRIRMNSVLFWN